MKTSVDFFEILYKLKKKDKKEILILLPEITQDLDSFCAGFSLKIILENMKEDFQVNILGEDYYNDLLLDQKFSFLETQKLSAKTLTDYAKERNSFDLLVTFAKENLTVVLNSDSDFSPDFTILFNPERKTTSACEMIFNFFQMFLIEEKSVSTGVLNSTNSTSVGWLFFTKNHQDLFFSYFKVPEEVYLLLYLGILVSFKKKLKNLVNISGDSLMVIAQLKKNREEKMDSLMNLFTLKVFK